MLLQHDGICCSGFRSVRAAHEPDVELYSLELTSFREQAVRTVPITHTISNELRGGWIGSVCSCLL
jgi:hypothetical protein